MLNGLVWENILSILSQVTHFQLEKQQLNSFYIICHCMSNCGCRLNHKTPRLVTVLFIRPSKNPILDQDRVQIRFPSCLSNGRFVFPLFFSFQCFRNTSCCFLLDSPFSYTSDKLSSLCFFNYNRTTFHRLPFRRPSVTIVCEK